LAGERADERQGRPQVEVVVLHDGIEELGRGEAPGIDPGVPPGHRGLELLPRRVATDVPACSRLDRSRRAFRNRTPFHDGTGPAPAVAPARDGPKASR